MLLAIFLYWDDDYGFEIYIIKNLMHNYNLSQQILHNDKHVNLYNVHCLEELLKLLIRPLITANTIFAILN